MLFNSYTFLFFFSFVLIIYWSSKSKDQNKVLLVSSYVFYGAWDYRFLSLILISTLIDFYVASYIAKDNLRKRIYLCISIFVNLGLLSLFKYYGFFLESLSALLSLLGIGMRLPAIDLIVPVGISFYTFQTMSYTIDVYKGKIKPIDNIYDFALYVSFFPQLVAGPIERSYNLIPQIKNLRYFNRVNLIEASYLILYGLFMKTVLADNMSILVDAIYSNDSSFSGLDLLLATYAFSFQIYGDFAGYSSIAIGTAKLLGFNLIKNFDSPYFSSSPSEFWKKWHISLSSWLRDYLYIPLGGNRFGKTKRYRNLMITMLLGGLWHGASWTYIIWGFYHATLLIVYGLISIGPVEQRADNQNLFKPFKVIVLYNLICLGWLVFRCESLSKVFLILERILNDFHATDYTFATACIILFFALPIFSHEFWEIQRGIRSFNDRPILSLIITKIYFIIMIIIFQAPTQKEFIYFQF